jgi:multicomponent Na+:H+ antiporter subunit D
MIVKANLFLISGVCRQKAGSFELGRLGGLYKNHGFITILFFISAFSLAGFPPLSGFWAKLLVIRAGLEAKAYVAAAAAIVVGLLTTYSMTKIWAEAFWKPVPEGEPETGMDAQERGRGDFWLYAPIVLLVMLTMAMGLVPGLFVDLAGSAAHELMNPGIYVHAVLGGGR